MSSKILLDIQNSTCEKNQMKIAILGFGPSSMFSIMACNDQGFAPTVVGGDIVRVPAGAFYYHWLPQEYSKEAKIHHINYKYVGNAGVYSEKQWGNENYPSSFWKYSNEIGYEPREVFSLFQQKSTFKYVHSGIMKTEDVLEYCGKYDIVVCTFPLPEIMEQAQKVTRPVIIRPTKLQDNIIIYSGKKEDKWVRWSNLFGTTYVEYCNFEDVPKEAPRIVPIVDLHPNLSVQMPFLPNNLFFSGRYAEFKRTRLAHEAYKRMEEILNAI